MYNTLLFGHVVRIAISKSHYGSCYCYSIIESA